jgi:thioredoxin reductase (NADPH)
MSMDAAQQIETDVVIIGAGPVGLFAIFELGMLKIRCHVIDTLDAIGGQCTALYPEKPIYDIPAHPSIDAQGLIDQLAAQAAPFEPTFHLRQQVVQMEKLPTGDWQLTTSLGTRFVCRAVIIAAGCGAFGPNRPPLDGLAAYEATGGVRYLVTQKELFKGKKLVIAGGGDSAVDWANLLAPDAAACYVVHRRDKFRAMPESVEQMRALIDQGKIELVVPYQLDGLEGEAGKLSGVRVKTLDGQTRLLEADYLLPFYGLSMELGPIAQWGLQFHKNHIAVDAGTCQTSEAGIYAIGDIAHYAHKLKLILCGFSEAAMAAHAIRLQLFPDQAYHFEYSTSKGVPAA